MPYTFKYGDRPLEGLTVQRAVGRGGFGEVYYAVTDSGKQVALKYLRENPEIELRGIAHVMNLKSPHLITIYDVKRNPAGEPFVIMEYVSGPSLRELMMNEPGGLGPQKAAFFLGGIAKGLSYLHERGIVHRDLKPANIFYDDGYVKIGDYGLSKHLSVSKHSGQTVSVGTVHYMAPEIGSGNYTKAIDIYALGVILYEMLTGRLPFSGSSMGEILMRHLRDNPDMSSVPQPFAAVIGKALAKDPNERYQDVNEMLAAVMDCADVSRSLESFDASALSQAPRRPDAQDDQTRTAGQHRPAPLPPLDVRDTLGWQERLNRGLDRLDQRLERVGQEVPDRLRRKLDRLNQKLEQKAARLEKKLGPPRYPTSSRIRPAEVGLVTSSGQLIVLLAVVGVLALGMGAVQGFHYEIASVLTPALYLIGGTIGPLLVHFHVRRGVNRGAFDRLAYASVAGVCMSPGLIAAAAAGHGDQFARVALAPLAAMLICNWSRRIEAGRSGHVRVWSAVWPGIVGLIVAGALDTHDNLMLVSGLLCAALSMLTQAAASAWRQARPHAGEPDGFPAGHRRRFEHGLPSIPDPHAGAPPAASVPLDRGPVAQPTPAAVTQATAAPVAVVQPEPARPTPAAPPDFAPAHASFVGRTASAGVSLLGKLLLLVGVLLVVSQDALLASARAAMERGLVADPDTQALLANPPRGLALIPIVLGSLVLIAARRRHGVAHFLRGCIGCLLVAGAALLAVAQAGSGFAALLTGGSLAGLKWEIPGLFITLALLAVGAFLLLWPRHDPRRPIVV